MSVDVLPKVAKDGFKPNKRPTILECIMDVVLDYIISLVYRIIRLINIVWFSKYNYKNY